MVKEWDLEDHHVRLLTLAAEAWDRAEEAKAILETEGITYKTRFGEPRAHPAVKTENDAKVLFYRVLDKIGLTRKSQGLWADLRDRGAKIMVKKKPKRLKFGQDEILCTGGLLPGNIPFKDEEEMKRAWFVLTVIG